MAGRVRVVVCALALLAGSVFPTGCYSVYTGTARNASAQQIAADPSWTFVSEVPFLPQNARHDCGAAALAMVMTYFRVGATVDEVSAIAAPNDEGIRIGALRDLARARGLQAIVRSTTLEDVADLLARGRPVVVGLHKPVDGDRTAGHYEVVVGINQAKGLILCLDPARGLRENTIEGFLGEWDPARRVALVVLPPPLPSLPLAGSAPAPAR